MSKPDKSYRPTGHLQPREDIPESQVRAICNLASDGYGYRQIFSLLRGIAPHNVTDTEVQRFGDIARNNGCGTNNHRLLLTQEAVNKALAKVKRMGKEACPVKPKRSTIAAFLEQAINRAKQAKKNRESKKRK